MLDSRILASHKETGHGSDQKAGVDQRADRRRQNRLSDHLPSLHQDHRQAPSTPQGDFQSSLRALRVALDRLQRCQDHRRLMTYDQFGSLILTKPNDHGWYVVQLDSGHFMATDGNHESGITVSLKDAKRWA